MPTEKLYERDPYLTTFSAGVLSCEQGKNGYEVVLDATAFYPEGGGQPADTGMLGGVRVCDVRSRAGSIIHVCDGPLTVGETVTGEIDWARRFDHMQQHSGEHICSGLICARFGCDNVGFHMGSDCVTIDFNASPTWEELLEIERAANRYVWEDHPIEIAFYEGGSEALARVDYRSKKELEGQVRIVTFPGADCCACCGTHVKSSGSVGMVKFLSCQKFRDGVRIELLCGERAVRFLSAVWEQNLHIAQSLSAKQEQSAAAVERLRGELAEARERCARLEEEHFAAVATRYAGAGDVLLFEDALSPDSVRKLCDAVMTACGGRCALFAGADGGWKYAVGQIGGDLREFTRELNAALSGRGGGKPFFVQGNASCTRAQIEAFFTRKGGNE